MRRQDKDRKRVALSSGMRKFNTEGPVVAGKHYCIPPLERVELDEILGLIRDERYFVLHAPRQTGKTSTLLALRDLLNSGAEGDFRCIYVNVETAQSARENVGAAMQAILAALARQERITLHARHLQAIWREALADTGPHEALQETLGRWAEADARPLVLLIDEIDTLIGDTLLAVLRQLRAGYPNRPRNYPQERDAVRCPRRARLPDPLERGERRHRRRQRLQHPGGIAAPRRLHGSRAAGAAHPAHRRDRTAVLGSRGRSGVDRHLRAAVAGERPLPPGLLRQQGGARPLARRSRATTSSTRGNT